MKLVIGLMILLLVFGCTSQTTDKNETIGKIVNNSENSKQNKQIGTEIENRTNRINNLTSSQNATIIVKSQKLQVIYFYSPTCPACQKINGTIINITNKYGEAVELITYNVRVQPGYGIYQEYANKFNLTNEQRLIPLVYVKDRVLNGFAEIRDELEGDITNSINQSQ